eukprot:TRINITY_DN2356_c0_g2_i1.p1 TRINITY_DN2356_c0_g2~~TRINITY_DN2356_c0_g2_i1.p1  ORF type:complete len:210 (-),score=34.47 TRINITY_DN2356_c0_g2_i1:114-743(-)
MSDGVVLRRNRVGSKNEELYQWPDQPLAEMDSPIAAQQYLQQMIRNKIEPKVLVTPPEGQDANVWQHEHLRQFTLELSSFVVHLDDVCTGSSCPKMKATNEYEFLCAAHKSPQECCAIDYMIHTLDGTAALLNSNRWFPSRVQIPESSVKYFESITRRLYRIFAHAYFHHRESFDEFENETRLCERFVVFSIQFNLIPQKHLIIPLPIA